MTSYMYRSPLLVSFHVYVILLFSIINNFYNNVKTPGLSNIILYRDSESSTISDIYMKRISSFLTVCLDHCKTSVNGSLIVVFNVLCTI